MSKIPHVWDDPMKGAFDAPFKVKVTLPNGETTMQTLYCFNRSDAEKIIEDYNARSIWGTYELAP